MGKYNNRPNVLFKPPSKAEVDAFITAQATPHDSSVLAPPPKPSAARSRSYADLLQRLYTEFDRLADDLSTSDAPPHQRADALSKLARALPLVQAAEAAAKHKSARGKDIASLTDAELEAAVAQQLRGKRDSLLAASSSRLVPTPAQNKKNESETLSPFPTSEDDSE